MLSIQLDPETERRLSELAKRTGQSEDDCARELIEEHIDDLEERYVAELRLQNRQPSLTSQQVRKELAEPEKDLWDLRSSPLRISAARLS